VHDDTAKGIVVRVELRAAAAARGTAAFRARTSTRARRIARFSRLCSRLL
jgi:hypothetical protein